MCAGDLDALASSAAQYCRESICKEITFWAPQPGAARAREKKRRDDLRRWRASGTCQREEAHAAPGRRPAEDSGGRPGRPLHRPACASPKSALADLREATRLALEAAPAPAQRGRSPGAAGARSRGAPPGLAARARGRGGRARGKAARGGARTAASEPPAERVTPVDEGDGGGLPRSQTYTEGYFRATDAHGEAKLVVKNTFLNFDGTEEAPSPQRSRSLSCPARLRWAVASAVPQDWTPRDQRLEASNGAETPPQPCAAAQGWQPPAGAAMVPDAARFSDCEDGAWFNIVVVMVALGSAPEPCGRARTPPRPPAAAAAPPPIPAGAARARGSVPEACGRARTPPRPSAEAAAPPPAPAGATRAGGSVQEACGGARAPPRPSAAAAAPPPRPQRHATSSGRPPPCRYFASGNCRYGDGCKNRPACKNRAGHLLPDATFEISLTREGVAELRLEADKSNPGTVLRITAVMEEGLVSEWNAERPSMSVKVGDYVMKCNGKAGSPTTISNEIRREGSRELRLTIMRMTALEEGQEQASTQRSPEPRLPPVEELRNRAEREVRVRWPGVFFCSVCEPTSGAGKGRLQPSDWRGLRSQQCRDCADLQSFGSGKGLGKGMDKCRECGKTGHWGNECKASQDEKDRYRCAAQQEEGAMALRALCTSLRNG